MTASFAAVALTDERDRRQSPSTKRHRRAIESRLSNPIAGQRCAAPGCAQSCYGHERFCRPHANAVRVYGSPWYVGTRTGSTATIEKAGRLILRRARGDLQAALTAPLFDLQGNPLRPASAAHEGDAPLPLDEVFRRAQFALDIRDRQVTDSELTRARIGYRVRAALALFTRRRLNDRPQAWRSVWTQAFGAAAIIDALRSYAGRLGFDPWGEAPAYPDEEARADWVAMRTGSRLLKIARHGRATRRSPYGRRRWNAVRATPNPALYRRVGGHVLATLETELRHAYGIDFMTLVARLSASGDDGALALNAIAESGLKGFERRPSTS